MQIRPGLQRIILEELRSKQQLRFFRGKGQSASIYAGASGKVLLSELNDYDLNILLKGLNLIPVGPKTITEKGLLLKELKKIKKQGYATSLGETFDGAVAIAVPIKNYTCSIALGVVGPESPFKSKIMPLLKSLKKSADNISSKFKNVSGIDPDN